MEDAAVHAADGLAAEPLLLLIAVLAVVLAGVSVFVAKKWDSHRKMEIEGDNDYKLAQLKLEQDREARKAKEIEQRNAREKETAILIRQSVEAQERSTMAINESTVQMAAMMAKLDISQQGSKVMRDKVEDMAIEVHDIHTVVVK